MKRIPSLITTGNHPTVILFLPKKEAQKLFKAIKCSVDSLKGRPSMKICIRILKMYNIPFKLEKGKKITGMDMIIPQGLVTKEFINRYFYR